MNEELISKIIQQDSDEAKRIIYERFVQSVYRLCRSYNGMSKEDAEDAVQEIFILVFRNLSSLNDPSAFNGWISAIARNHCLGVLKGKIREKIKERKYLDERKICDPSPGEQLMIEHEIQIVHDLIGSVHNSQHRETVELFYIQGLTCEQISERQGIQVTTVTTRLARFRAQIQRKLIGRILELRGSHE